MIKRSSNSVLTGLISILDAIGFFRWDLMRKDLELPEFALLLLRERKLLRGSICFRCLASTTIPLFYFYYLYLCSYSYSSLRALSRASVDFMLWSMPPKNEPLMRVWDCFWMELACPVLGFARRLERLSIVKPFCSIWVKVGSLEIRRNYSKIIKRKLYNYLQIHWFSTLLSHWPAGDSCLAKYRSRINNY